MRICCFLLFYIIVNRVFFGFCNVAWTKQNMYKKNKCSLVINWLIVFIKIKNLQFPRTQRDVFCPTNSPKPEKSSFTVRKAANLHIQEAGIRKHFDIFGFRNCFINSNQSELFRTNYLLTCILINHLIVLALI